MRVFYVNLDSRPDRRAFIEAELAKCALTAERVAAISSEEVKSSGGAMDGAAFNLDLLAPAEIGCVLSHRKAWQAMLDQGLQQALFLEDDMQLSPLLPAFLKDADDLTIPFDILRLETRLDRVRLSRDTTALSCGVELRRFFTLQFGFGGYIMRAACARRFMSDPRLFEFPIDHTFFDPDCPSFHEVDTLQVIPGLCAPGGSTREKEGLWRSDIQPERRDRQVMQMSRLPAIGSGPAMKAARELQRVAMQGWRLGCAVRDFIRRPFVSMRIPYWDSGLN
jgi:glycosyl transferase, family 25